MNYLENIFSNTVLKSAIFGWFIAQFLKIIIELFSKKKIKNKEQFIIRALFGTGGMPSSHSATIAAVTIAIGIKEGLDSSVFALSVVLLLIIVRDATGVRLSAGKQAEAINKIIENENAVNKNKYEKIKEVKGHTPTETLVGLFVGALVSLGINLLEK